MRDEIPTENAIGIEFIHAAERQETYSFSRQDTSRTYFSDLRQTTSISASLLSVNQNE